MQIGRLSRVAASLAALLIAGPAAAGTMEIGHCGLQPEDLLRDERGIDYLGGVLPTTAFELADTIFGETSIVVGRNRSFPAARARAEYAVVASLGSGNTTAQLEQASFGPVHQAASTPAFDEVVFDEPAHTSGQDSHDYIKAVPEPSAALLLALGMTVTGAHLRARRQR